MTASTLTLLTQGQLRQDLLERISEEVQAVEAELATEVRSTVDLVQSVSELTLRAGGKRLRPAFVALAARSIGNDIDAARTHRLGACMELIHMATLVHDDVIDNASTRRGRPTASAQFGNTAAILSGDVLLAKAMLILAKDGDVRLIETVSQAVVAIVEGEVKELEVRGDFDLKEECHLDVLRMKTASLIECCCEMGAIVADASEVQRLAIRAYGFHIGMAFQIVDDLLDYRGDQAKTGKPRATDFREGQATLPLIYLRPLLSEAESKIVRRKFGNNPNEDELRMLADWMDSRGAFKRAESVARFHVDKAIESTQALISSDARELLEGIAEYILSRQV